MSGTLLRGALVVPVDGPPTDPVGDVRAADVRIEGERIAAVGPGLEARPGDAVLDCAGLTLLPGFVQGHVHYCQTLFRGLADDLPLLAWLVERIWPLEAAHDAASTRASAELSVAELLRGGTTTVQVMESVRHAEQSFEVAARTGMTTILGNCLFDLGEGAPAGFATSPAEALRISEQLVTQFHGAGRLRYAVSPRFVLSCSDELGRTAADFARTHDLRVHTHACEHPDEVDAVRRALGREAMLVLADQGLLGPRTSLAHCVHLTEDERRALVESGAAVLHCPSTNLKLGSGIAQIASLHRAGVRVALGADGAPCNNRLSALTELRQAALLSCLAAGPGTWPAAQALHALTRGGAAALGLDGELGSVEVGKRADLVLVDLGGPRLDPGGDVVSRLVWSATDAEVRHVFVGGAQQVRDGALTDLDAEGIAAEARVQQQLVMQRAGLRA